MNNIILSYPRSGNHFTRYIIEFLTERPTLGLTSQDGPIHERSGPKLLPNITNNNPIAVKKHWASDIKSNADSLILILRNPVEAILSARFETYFKKICCEEPVDSKILNDYEFDSRRFVMNLEYFIKFEGPKEIVLYEDLIGNNYEKYIDSMSKIFHFEESKVNDLVSNFGKYRIDSMKSTNRKPISLSKKSTNEFYADKIKKINPDNFDAYLSSISEVLNHKLIREYYD